MKILTELDMNSNQISNSGFENLTTLPNSNLFKGRLVFNTTDNTYYQYNGTKWIALVDLDVLNNSIESKFNNSVGKNVTGEKYTVNNTEYTAGSNAEIFNDYKNNKSIGEYSHTEGAYNTASGAYSHAEGSNTTASGIYSHAESRNTIALGGCSHAEGSNTTASGSYSHVEGRKSKASGSCSHAEGEDNIASGAYSHAEGLGTKAASANQHVQGKYNIEDANSKFVFIIGNGVSDTARSNAFAIDWDGKIYVNNSPTGIQLFPNVDLTLDEYNALSNDEKNNGTYYNIIES